MKSKFFLTLVFVFVFVLACVDVEAANKPGGDGLASYGQSHKPGGSGLSSDRQSQKPYGGTLTLGVHTQPTAINPIFTSQSISVSLVGLIFNGLVRISPKGEMVPDLAESWIISEDGLVYTFYLRKGVKFHDGVELTSVDVKFTYDSINDPANNSPFRPSFQLVKDFKVIDKYTFQLLLNKSSVPFIYRLFREVAPKHLLEGRDLKNCPFNSHPVGTGPFRFKEWTKEGGIALEYNPDYYEGRPYLDKIIVKVYSNLKSAWVAFMRGEVDYTGFIDREDYEIVKKDSSFKTYAFAVDGFYAIVYDMRDSMLKDARVREAIAQGVDVKNLIDSVALGYGLECQGPFYPQSLGYNSMVKPLGYNPEKSKELLTEAGFADIDNNGIVEKDGRELELRILVDRRSDINNKIIMVLRQQLQEIGIKVKVILYDSDDNLTEEFLEQEKVQAHLTFVLAGSDPDQEADIWTSDRNKKNNRLWAYKNETINKLFESGEITHNEQKRKEIYQEIYQLIYKDQPVCFLYFPFVFHVVSNRFGNTDDFFTLSMPFYTIKDWFINKKKGGEQNGSNQKRV